MKQVFFTGLCALLIGIFVVPLVLSAATKEDASVSSSISENTGYAQMDKPAPKLTIQKWIKNGPVNIVSGRGKHVYVIEFWGTYCPPCRESIPLLTDIQRRFRDKGVVVVGISGEDVGTVQQFVNAMGSQMDYSVAVDRNGRTANAYLRPFRVEGIPHAYIIDREGNLVWHGHPMFGMDAILERYVD